MIQFTEPQWFLLLLVFLFLRYAVKSLELYRPLRMLCILLAVLALANPTIKTKSKAMEVIVLADRSTSAQAAMADQLAEWEEILIESKGADDQLKWIDFAEEAIDRSVSDQSSYNGGRKRTRLALAIQAALAMREPSLPTRILALTDGQATDDLSVVEPMLLESGVPFDYRLAYETPVGDYRVQELKIPAQMQLGQPFLIEASVMGAPDREISYTLFRNDQVVDNGSLTVQDGVARLRLFDRLQKAGATEYRLSINAPDDPQAGNNHKTKWITVSGEQRVLLLSAWTDDPVASVLERNNIQVELITDYSSLNAGSLAGVTCVLIHNVPANELPDEFIDAAGFYVREQGGGLIMFGGKYSFGSGGYHETTIGDALPVTAQLREEHRKLSTAMVIIMDRSGSMGAPVVGNLTKMDLANAAASESVNLLGAMDSLSVIAVDSEPDVVVPMTQVANNTEAIQSRVRRIVPTGGGIFVYNGLKAAHEQLRQTSSGQRHIILFSDAADSEQPDSYKSLLSQMRQENTTVSVIGLGSTSDVDAAFLQDIAKRGSGRIFFTQDAGSLPSLFAQETVAVARSAFIEDPVGVAPAAGWLQVSPKLIDWQPFIAGYNLTYLKEGATAASFSVDEYEAPLVAFWQQGTGRSAAVSFPMAGTHAQTQLDWKSYSRFLTTLAQWAMRSSLPDGIAIQTVTKGEEEVINLFYAQNWEARLAMHSPRIVISESSGKSRELAWERMRPGHYQSRLSSTNESTLINGAVQLEGTIIPFGPFRFEDTVEWIRNEEILREIATLAKKSNGKQRLNLSSVWAGDAMQSDFELRYWLLLVLLLFFIMEAYHKRFMA